MSLNSGSLNWSVDCNLTIPSKWTWRTICPLSDDTKKTDCNWGRNFWPLVLLEYAVLGKLSKKKWTYRSEGNYLLKLVHCQIILIEHVPKRSRPRDCVPRIHRTDFDSINFISSIISGSNVLHFGSGTENRKYLEIACVAKKCLF